MEPDCRLPEGSAYCDSQAMNLPCSHRGPSLNTLTKALGIKDLRAKKDGTHGAKIDSLQSALVVEVMRCCGNTSET